MKTALETTITSAKKEVTARMKEEDKSAEKTTHHPSPMTCLVADSLGIELDNAETVQTPTIDYEPELSETEGSEDEQNYAVWTHEETGEKFFREMDENDEWLNNELYDTEDGNHVGYVVVDEHGNEQVQRLGM